MQGEQIDSSPCTEIKARFEERYQKLVGWNDYEGYSQDAQKGRNDVIL